MEGRLPLVADPPSPAAAAVDGVAGLRTLRTGAAVSARLRVMLRVPVEFAGVVMPTVGAVVDDGVSEAAAPLALRFDTRDTPPRPPGVGCHPAVVPGLGVRPVRLASLCDVCSGLVLPESASPFGWLRARANEGRLLRPDSSLSDRM